MTEIVAEIVQKLAAAALGGLNLYLCWTQRMRLLPVAVTAVCGAAAWWLLSPSVVIRIMDLVG